MGLGSFCSLSVISFNLCFCPVDSHASWRDNFVVPLISSCTPKYNTPHEVNKKMFFSHVRARFPAERTRRTHLLSDPVFKIFVQLLYSPRSLVSRVCQLLSRRLPADVLGTTSTIIIDLLFLGTMKWLAQKYNERWSRRYRNGESDLLSGRRKILTFAACILYVYCLLGYWLCILSAFTHFCFQPHQQQFVSALTDFQR